MFRVDIVGLGCSIPKILFYKLKLRIIADKRGIQSCDNPKLFLFQNKNSLGLLYLCLRVYVYSSLPTLRSFNS